MLEILNKESINVVLLDPGLPIYNKLVEWQFKNLVNSYLFKSFDKGLSHNIPMTLNVGFRFFL
jgi:hypothetical protein